MAKETYLIEYQDRMGNVFMKDIKLNSWRDAQNYFQKVINKNREFLLISVSEY